MDLLFLEIKSQDFKFSTEDVDLLRDIRINAGATIERIKLQEQLIREQLAAERLEELNNQKSMFVSTVSHDLKTPLTSIKILLKCSSKMKRVYRINQKTIWKLLKVKQIV